MTQHQVLIAGAGPTGMMLAAELALAGIDVAIVERRMTTELRRPGALGLHARTIEVFEQRGIADTGEPTKLIDHIHKRIVADEDRVVTTSGRRHGHKLQDRARALLHRYALTVDLNRQEWSRTLDAIADVNGRLVRVGTDLECDGQAHRPTIR